MAKKSIISLFLIFVLTLVAVSSIFAVPNNAYANANIFADIKNASFENTQTEQFEKPFATDWLVSGEEVIIDNINIISTKAYDKTNYWQFEKGSYSVKSEEYFEIESSAEYLFGVKFIFSNSEDSCSILVETYNAEDELLNTHQSQVIISKQEYVGLWQEAILQLTTESQAVKAKISIEICAEQGTVGIDNVYAYKNFIKLDSGASICLDKNVLQIRFTAKVDVESYQNISHNFHYVSVGIVFAPKQQVESVGEFTIKGIPLNGNIEAIDVDHWNNPNTYQQDGFYSFYAAFGQIGYEEIENFLDGEIVARAYIKYTENGKEKYVYSNWNIEDNCRSIRQVAQKAKQDERVYNSYSLTQKEIISAYIEGREPNFDNLD